ncbi:hypothetical protein NK662_23310, partial [Ectobacillus sp. SYSU M60031]|nr:hypothetical protein [Ectobacillus ponti]
RQLFPLRCKPASATHHPYTRRTIQQPALIARIHYIYVSYYHQIYYVRHMHASIHLIDIINN